MSRTSLSEMLPSSVIVFPVALVQVVAGADRRVAVPQLDGELRLALHAHLERLTLQRTQREHLPGHLEHGVLRSEREVLDRSVLLKTPSPQLFRFQAAIVPGTIGASWRTRLPSRTCWPRHVRSSCGSRPRKLRGDGSGRRHARYPARRAACTGRPRARRASGAAQRPRVAPRSGVLTHCDPELARTERELIIVCDEGYQSSLAAATLAAVRAKRHGRDRRSPGLA